jgi:glutamine amidotransferase-like uncharacterized protein
MNKSHIVVYCDRGVGALSLLQLIKSLKVSFPLAKISRISQECLLKGCLQQNQLLIMPGGRDIDYSLYLNKEATEVILDFVHQGGRYLGICAGAYFASSYVRFQLDTDTTFIDSRPLNFFSGEAIGPAYRSSLYEYESLKECKVICLKSLQSDFKETYWAYYNAGCIFKLLIDPIHPYRPLLEYPEITGINNWAVVECWPKKGYSLLCGIHPEYHYSHMPTKQNYSKILKEQLREHQESIQDLFVQLVSRALRA